MRLTKHLSSSGPRWAADGEWLAPAATLSLLLAAPADKLPSLIESLRTGEAAHGPVLAPIEASQEVWACGVTYMRSRDARMAESSVANVYDKVYDAQRPEIFFKSAGWRVVGDGEPIRIRADSNWNVPEPELVLVVGAGGRIVGYTVGNDVSSREIEGANPLYLPQAKTYTGSCALGSGIELAPAEAMRELPVSMNIQRAGEIAFAGETSIARMKRGLDELAAWLFKELTFPSGVFVMTGTGIVPPESFSLRGGDVVAIRIGDSTLTNAVAGG